MKKFIFINICIFSVSSLLQSSHNLINTLDRRNILDTAFSEERNFMLKQNVISNNTEVQIVPNQSSRPTSLTARIESLRQQAISRLVPGVEILTPSTGLSQVPAPRRRLQEENIGTLALSSRYY